MRRPSGFGTGSSPLGGEPAAAPAREGRFEPGGWGRALAYMLVVTAVVWAASLVDLARGNDLDTYGLVPRTVDGLAGVLTAPFLHHSTGQLLSDTLPFLLLGWVVMMSGLRTWAIVSGLVLVVGGLVCWVIAPHTYVGDSMMVFGWLGYLLARAWFARRVVWILAALMVVLVFGSLLSALLPLASGSASDPWQVHLVGFAAGVAVAAVLHPRRKPGRPGRGASRSA